MRRTIRSILCSVSLLAFIPYIASAQVPTGTPPFGSFGGGPDIINLANLNSHITVPVIHKAGRGTNFTYDLSYDTSVWYPVGTSGSQSWTPVQNWDWRGQTEVATGYVSYGQSYTSVSCVINRIRRETNWYVYQGYAYHDAFGVAHSFPGVTMVVVLVAGGCPANIPASNPSGTSTDGSGYKINLTGGSGATPPTSVVTARNGTLINAPSNSGTGAGNFIDRNGNEITVNGSGQFFDTLSSSTPVLTVAGSQTPSSPTTFTYPAPSGANATYTMKYITYTVKTNFGCGGVAEYGPTSNNLVSEIDLPDGSKYTLTYEPTPGFSGDVTGRLASVTLPTGGTISYTYTGGSSGHITCSDGSASGLTRQTLDGTWTYSRTFGTAPASTTTITDPQNNQTKIQFQSIYETLRQVYVGAIAQIDLLHTWNTCYNGAASPCTGTSITLPITRRTVTDQDGPSGVQSKHDFFYSAYGVLTEQDDYDYGASGPGSLLRKTVITIASLGNINAFRQTTTICNPSGTASACNGSGTVVAQTTNNYDESTPTPTSGTPQHVAVSGSRGNLTSVNHLVQGSTTLISHATYYDTGTVNTSTDVNGAVTTFVYGTASCGNSFPTSISEPLSMSRSMAWNCNGGVQTSVTDENSQVTSTTWNDPDFWRPAATNFPDGGQTSIAYNSATSVTSTTKMNSTQNIVGTVLLDGLGRTRQTQLNSDPQGVDYVDTTYDSLGRVASVSNPHRSAASSTDGTTMYGYDVLNRTTSVTLQDGSVSRVSYFGNTTTATDPAGKATKSVYDSLGRTTQIFEDPAGLNYETDYSFDVLDNVLSVTQKGGSTSANYRNRTFAYDGLSRLTSETNPESGTSTYSYDVVPTGCSSPGTSYPGDLTRRLDAAGNAICNYYDALHRLTDVGTASGCKRFRYDNTTGVTGSIPSGVTLSSELGRLAEAETDACTLPLSPLTDQWFSYDRIGRVTNAYQRPPTAVAAGTTFTVPFAYDLAGNTTSYGTGNSGVTFSQSFDSAGRATQLTGSSVDSQHPASLASVNWYTPVSSPELLTYGNNLGELHFLNNTMELCRININSNPSVSIPPTIQHCSDDLQYSTLQDYYLQYNEGSTNNGNVSMWQGTYGQTFHRNFGYDSLNRVSSMNDTSTNGTSSCKGLSWTYDAWGNRTDQTQTAGVCGEFHASANPQNQIVDLINHVYQYDAAGNMTADASHHTYTYDAENRLIKVDGGNTASYTYDALGRRVEKITGSTKTDYVYDLSGNVVAEVNNVCASICWAAFYANLNGQPIAEYKNGTTYFLHGDHLGSTRLVSSMEANQIPNPGFEQGMTNWLPDTGPTIVTDTTKAHSGNNYLYISTSTGAEATSSQQVAVTPGQVVTFGGWVYRETGSGGYSRWSIEVLDSTKTIITYINCPNVTTAAWTFNQTSYTIPSGAAYVQLYASIYLPTDLTAVRFDDGFLYIQGSGVSIVQNLDYLPFGELNSTDSGISTHKFTGDEHDAETSFDHTQFRQYTSSLARWMSPDPAGLAAVDPTNPQSWNRYSYVLNNPVGLIDPSGLGPGVCDVHVWDNPGCLGGGGGFFGGGGLSDCSDASLTLEDCGGSGPGFGIIFIGGDDGAGGGGSPSRPAPQPSPIAPSAPQFANTCQLTGACSTDIVCQYGFCSTGPQFGQGFLQMPNPQVIDEGWQFIIKVVVWGVAIYEAARVAISNIHLSRATDRIRGIPRLDQLQRGCKLGRRVEEPSRTYPGGRSVEQEYICPFGTYTVHELFDANGNLIESHVRPGSPKGGGL